MHFWIIWSMIGLLQVFSETDAETKMSNHKLSGVIKWKYEKRPFCNAFTGCGRKRSEIPIGERDNDEKQATYEDVGEALSDLIDINAEPAVENVQKQIMSQAKIFEAIKEASKEIVFQKNKNKLRRPLLTDHNNIDNV